MAKKRYTALEIIGKPREVEIRMNLGVPVAEAVRRIGLTEQTYYRWRKEYGGLKLDQSDRPDLPVLKWSRVYEISPECGLEA